MMESILTIVGAVVIACGFLFIMPLVSFWISYLGGWVVSIVIGTPLVEGLNLLFNTDYFTKDMIPLCAATLGWIGGYFKSSVNLKKDK